MNGGLCAIWGENMPQPEVTNRLSMPVADLEVLGRILLTLTDVTSDRLSVGQVSFFFAAARADARGRPATLSEILNANGHDFGKSIHNTYRQLLLPSQRRPNALGWLVAEENPLDRREKFLRLTPLGRDVVESVLNTTD